MLINNWYVACESAAVGAEPLGIRMLGQSFVLFRDGAGEAHCLAGVCVHRGGPLCKGRLIDDTVRCPYHGWRFDGSGRCVEIPSIPPDAKIPKRAKVDSYPVEERWGWTWVFLGDLPEDERPGLPGEAFFPEWYAQERGSEDYRFLHGSFVFDANWKRCIENILDPAHPFFVHGEFGNLKETVVPPFEVEVDGEKSSSTHRFRSADKSGSWRDADTGVDSDNRIQLFWAGLVFRNDVRPRPDWHHLVMSAYTPIDEAHTQTYWIHARDFLREPEQDAVAAKRVHQVYVEDAAVIDHVLPLESPVGGTVELLMEADRHIVEFRKRAADDEARGWRIDIRRRRDDDRIVYAIPSPRRRSESGWVLEPVPLTDH